MSLHDGNSAAVHTANRLAPAEGRVSGLLSRLRHAVPTAAVLLLLGGVGYWGRHTEWTFTPSPAAPPAAAEWCDRHGVEASICVECNPALLPKPPTFGWCERHGVYDCPLEHPEVAQLAKPAAVTAADFARAEKALQARQRPANDPECARHFRRIQFASAEAAEKAGIGVETALALGITETVAASAEVGYDQTTLSRLPARAAGPARRVLKKEGDVVKRGDVLAVIDAAEVGKTKADFMQALIQTRQRQRTLNDLQGIAEIAPAQVRAAEADLREAEIRLRTAEEALANYGLNVRAADFAKLAADEASAAIRLAGLPAAATIGLNPKSATANLVAIVAPRDGTVLRRDVAPGEFVTANKDLFVVGDASRVWINLHVAPAEAPLLAAGQMVRFQPDGTTAAYTARLAWVGVEADRKTRMAPARAELANDKGEVRAGTFGVARVVLREAPEAIVVPAEAVQMDGGCTVVFVRDKDYLKPGAPKVFHPRMVRVGARDGPDVEIIAGLLVNEVVAGKGSGLLLKELQKNAPPGRGEARTE